MDAPTDRPAGATPSLALVGMGAVLLTAWGALFIEQKSFAAYVWSALAHGLLYCGAVWLIVRRPPRAGDLALVLIIAVVIRGLAATAPMNLTTDALRYVWDGRIQWAGFNPYLWVPAAPELVQLRDAVIYPDINQKETAVTIYPPVAEMVFLLANRISDSLEGIRIVFLAFEALAVWAMLAWLRDAGERRERIVIYAWHPLPVWEIASQMHIDVVAIAFMMLALVAVGRQRQGVAGALLGAAVLAKYFPIVLAPAIWRRWDWRMPAALAATAVLLYLPYAAGAGGHVLGFLFRHLDNEGYRQGFGFHVVWLMRDFHIADPPGWLYVACALAVLGALALYTFLGRPRGEVRACHLVLLAGAFIWLTSPHYAWYFAWVIPLMVRFLSPAVVGMTMLALFQNMPGSEDRFFNTTAFYLTVFGLSLVLLLAEAIWRLRAQRSA
jgi:hypothetical protein